MGKQCRLTVGGECYEIQCIHRKCQRRGGVQQARWRRRSQAVPRRRTPVGGGTEARATARARVGLHRPRGPLGQADLPRLDGEGDEPRAGTRGTR